MSQMTDEQAALWQEVERAVAGGKLTESASENLRRWLTESRYAAYAGEVAQHIRDQQWKVLDDVFWTVIPFGTGGRRGRMYPIGSNAINDRTIGESAQGLAEYVRQSCAGGGEDEQLACGIAYDSRHRSRHFAELCASIMVANGFQVFFLDDYRSTPELSFLIRHRNCHCGIMVTASHNPPSDNAVKVYWSTGGQVLPPHDKNIIERVMQVGDIATVDFDRAVTEGKVVICTGETDNAYQAVVLDQQHEGPRDIRVLYSPLHGVGKFSVVPVLERAGFEQVELYAPQAEPNGDFPHVPGHVANPENPAVFEVMADHARDSGADIILATDPDCDRMGCATPLTWDADSPYRSLTGNQLGALLADYLLGRHEQLTANHFVVKTLVTTDLIRRVADQYGVRTVGDLLVGFKYIGGVIDDEGPQDFIFGTEESHGYLTGTYARDKDGAVACLLIAELAALCKAEGRTLHQQLAQLFRTHGYHCERLMTIAMPGSQGMQQMEKLMQKLRSEPPRRLGGLQVAQCRDYLEGTIVSSSGSRSPLEGPHGNLLFFDFEQEGNAMAIRPSGTEPKIKCYMFGYESPAASQDLDAAAEKVGRRLDAIEADMRTLAEST